MSLFPHRQLTSFGMEVVARQPETLVFASENPSKPIWRDNAWYRHIKPKLDPIGLGWATFQVLRRTHASLGHDSGIDPKVAADQRGHGIGVAMDAYTKAALSRRAEMGRTARKRRAHRLTE